MIFNFKYKELLIVFISIFFLLSIFSFSYQINKLRIINKELNELIEMRQAYFSFLGAVTKHLKKKILI